MCVCVCVCVYVYSRSSLEFFHSSLILSHVIGHGFRALPEIHLKASGWR